MERVTPYEGEDGGSTPSSRTRSNKVWHVRIKPGLHLEAPSLQRGNLPSKTLKCFYFGDETKACPEVLVEPLPKVCGVQIKRG